MRSACLPLFVQLKKKMQIPWMQAKQIKRSIGERGSAVQLGEKNVHGKKTKDYGHSKPVHHFGFLAKEQYDVEKKFIGEYKIESTIGSGSSGRVFLASSKRSNVQVAIKVVDRKATSVSSSDSSLEEVQSDRRIFREAVISSLISHPNIVRMLDFLYSDKHFFLVFEYVKGEQLYDSVVRLGKIPEEKARRYFRQILSAIEYIHHNSIVHRDLKIENILVDENDNIRIIDFGLSNFYDNSSLLWTFCGSLYFAAPELLIGQRYQGPEVDVWSLGIILYVMLCGKVPFDDESVHVLQAKIKEGKVEFGTSLSSEAKSLLSKMIVTDPAKRMSLKDAKKAEWTNKDYSYDIDSFADPNKPIKKLDKTAMKILSTTLAFQFPNAEAELKSYGRLCAKGFASIDKIYWTSRPVVSMYRMLVEEAPKRDQSVLALFESLYMKEKRNEINFPALIHTFVHYIFAGMPSDLYARYFSFRLVESGSSESNSRSTPQLVWPSVRNSYIKGIFRGIKVKNIDSASDLKAMLVSLFGEKGITHEADEKSYFCTFKKDSEECYFKVSMYFNVILSVYFLHLTCLNSKRNLFKTVYSVFEKEFSKRKKGNVHG